MTAANKLFYGDNLDVLRRHVKDESVDLVYLDPPFNSSKDYNVLFSERDGSRAAAQVKAFEDTWEWGLEAEAAYQETVEAGGRPSDALQAFRSFLGTTDMLAYLCMMAPRLVELRRVLRPTASIYLHCDPTASHYLKMLMDAIFGSGCFQNEIIWYYKGAGLSPKRWARRHDIILWYSRGKEPYFDPDPVRDEYAESTKARFSHYIGNVRGGRDFGVQSLNPKGKHPDDVWQIPIVAPSARARLPYPTQKPEPLLERIILSSSAKGAVVLDPFCGCGTTIAVAHRLERRWIGIDITHLAIGLIKNRLQGAFGPGVKAEYQVIGEPVTIADAETLAKTDPFQFQAWALGLVGARVESSSKKGADRGVDGRLDFHDEKGAKTKKVMLSVKGGKVGVAQVRDLRGVMEREKAEMGALISFESPTGPMRAEAASAGFYVSPANRKYARLQLLTVADLLRGRELDYPGRGLNVTLRPAPAAAVAERQYGFDLEEASPARRGRRRTDDDE